MCERNILCILCSLGCIADAFFCCLTSPKGGEYERLVQIHPGFMPHFSLILIREKVPSLCVSISSAKAAPIRKDVCGVRPNTNWIDTEGPKHASLTLQPVTCPHMEISSIDSLHVSMLVRVFHAARRIHTLYVCR